MRRIHCCVRNCRRSSHNKRGKMILNGVSFHCFPAWRRNEGAQTCEVTRRRRAAWVAAVARSNITFDHIPSSMRVCSRHFLSGKPAYEMLESDPDWVPSLHLGHGDRGSTRARSVSPSGSAQTDQDQRWPTEAVSSDVPSSRQSDTTGGAGRPGALALSEAKALLSSLQRKTTSGAQRSSTPVERTNQSFKDFFRDALEASLDVSSRSRARPQRSREDSSSSCPNCVRLQKRVEELEKKLLCLTGRQQDTWTSPVSPDMAAHEPNLVQEEETEWMEPLSPPPDNVHDSGDDDAQNSSSAAAAAAASVSQAATGRFNPQWLAVFPFLRYSPADNVMWCHVCRLYANDKFKNLGIIKGSRMFKRFNLNIHAQSRYHNDCVKRYKQLHS